MKVLTLDLLKSMKPCACYTTNDYRHSKKLFKDKTYLTPREIFSLPIPEAHKLWVLLRMIPDAEVDYFFIELIKKSIKHYNNEYYDKIDLDEFISVVEDYFISHKIDIVILNNHINKALEIFHGNYNFLYLAFNYIINMSDPTLTQSKKLHYICAMCSPLIARGDCLWILNYLVGKIEDIIGETKE